ncbi:TetR/AcrR family transcriptional regulator [Actinomadura livida]|uniref:AcrR family transcriptional regulator n=1 Tax=Actinomadura livida TaxID=79909 RepID=A0A7W7IIE9_9ACTN|nr:MULTISPECIES: TetR/AcrR family transcriptional regulator C-terminal domain-containing protein [Actinomadura]MBB4777541.1 AcrR family transcriptional regulator [Actinomadura catellatispora]GGU00406.1 TetR family transcriptional regulator [Actinomadura livida]
MTRNATPGPVRPVLTRERIVLAAVALIERESADALSMRRVAAELGVAVMSLYNHVPNKSALLEGVAEHVVSGLELHDDPSEPWQERARALVRAFRKVAHDNPRCMTIVLTHKIDTPVALRPAERALALADAAGFDAETAVRIMRALLAYALGAQLREVGMSKMLGHLAETGAQAWSRLDPDEFPHVLAYGPELAGVDAEADFEFGLDLLIGALDRLPRRPPHRG